MPVRSVDRRGVRPLRLADSNGRAPRVKLVRSRVDLIAPTAARVVHVAGGWIFDLVATGWDVAVHVIEAGDTRPLLILGTDPLELDRSSPLLGRLAGPHILAVDARLYESDAWVRQRAQEAAGRLGEVRLWGEPENPDGATHLVIHQLSLAARAFKAQAVAAAGGRADALDSTEMFRRLGRRWPADLTERSYPYSHKQQEQERKGQPWVG
jgi:hypothetical protein